MYGDTSSYGSVMRENEQLRRENARLMDCIRGKCEYCAHRGRAMEDGPCHECGAEGRNWAWISAQESPCITQRPMSLEEAEAEADATMGEVYLERYAMDEIVAVCGEICTDMLSPLRRALYGMAANDGIVCGYRYWRYPPTEAERMSADWKPV